MHYLALASDYDGTLAQDSHVSDEALAAVRRLKASGRKFILVTGRELPELQSVFPDFQLCDAIIAENGALLVWPANLVGVGDAENDHAFLESCAVAAAVNNALPLLKERCDMVLTADHGAGVVELIDRLLATDLQELGTRRPRKELVA